MLHEFERIALQKIALQKLNNSDLGVTTRIPKGEPAPAYSRNALWPFFLNIVWKLSHIIRNNSDVTLTPHDGKGQLISKCLFGIFNSPKK